MTHTAPVDPISQPLRYPGNPPASSGIVTNSEFLPLAPTADLDHFLADLSQATMADRHPVIAVGSNASIDQLRRKFRNQLLTGDVIPMLLMTVEGIAAGVSAHVSKPGYVPATPLAVQGASLELFVLWLSDAQLVVLDETEPNYRRTRLPGQLFPTWHQLTGTLPHCSIYVSKHGCLTDSIGAPFRLEPQPDLLTRLLADLPSLRTLAGHTPETFVQRMQHNPLLRDQVKDLFHHEGRSLPQPEFAVLQ
jgi:hypothetical protein